MFFIGLFTGFYIALSLFTFLYLAFACILGGRGNDLVWKPLIYAILWPIFLPLFLTGKA